VVGVLNIAVSVVRAVAPIDHMYAENSGLFLGIPAQPMADHIKSNDFNQSMD